VWYWLQSGCVGVGWAGLFLPVGTPEGIVKKVSDDLQAIMKEPSMQQYRCKEALSSYLIDSKYW
jgi:tripartite-type tricarboxylate transporter receptor subunit TctC